MKTYIGTVADGERSVTADGKRLDPRLDLMNASPTGFAWGYGGSGPAQLALAILADCLGDATALECFHAFKWDVIAPLDTERPWKLTETDVRDWLQTHLRRQHAEEFDAQRDDHPLED